ncbi:hypothetical protein LPB79_12990 [Rhizobium sp. T136]|uniref:hypothetical protein n=1 Tax=Rhizobium sp. T136 TaxID=555319 RepID=UPI001E306826|nr:hypothetical protein [Rhizobium sp. T136]UFS83162.1 hypothetical protein LPB79_12990 [Rhizobium sp. T136]
MRAGDISRAVRDYLNAEYPEQKRGAEMPVSVKALQWEYRERQMMTYVVKDYCGVIYHINQTFGSDSYYFTTVRYDGEILYDGDDLPSAQEAAQAGHERRILSTLIATPKPEAEPVAWTDTKEIESVSQYGTGLIWDKDGHEQLKLTRPSVPLYAHPPKPEATNDWFSQIVGFFVKHEMMDQRDEYDISDIMAALHDNYAPVENFRYLLKNVLDNDGGEGSQCYDARLYYDARKAALAALASTNPDATEGGAHEKGDWRQDDKALIARLRDLVDNQSGGDAVMLVQRQLFNKAVGRLAALTAKPEQTDSATPAPKEDSGHEKAGISRALMGRIVDEVFDGAIEDASVIEEIYAVIRSHEAAPLLDKLPAAFEVLDQENGTYLTRSEIAAQNSGFEYNGLYRRDSAEASFRQSNKAEA